MNTLFQISSTLGSSMLTRCAASRPPSLQTHTVHAHTRRRRWSHKDRARARARRGRRGRHAFPTMRGDAWGVCRRAARARACAPPPDEEQGRRGSPTGQSWPPCRGSCPALAHLHKRTINELTGQSGSPCRARTDPGRPSPKSSPCCQRAVRGSRAGSAARWPWPRRRRGCCWPGRRGSRSRTGARGAAGRPARAGERGGQSSAGVSGAQ